MLNAGVQLSAEYHGPNGPEALTSGLLQVPDDGAGGNIPYLFLVLDYYFYF